MTNGGQVMKTAPAFEESIKTNLFALFPAKYKMLGKMKEKDGSVRDMSTEEYVRMSTRSAAKSIAAWETTHNAALTDAQKAAVYFATTVFGVGNGRKFAANFLNDSAKLGEEFEAFMKSIKIGEIGRGYTGNNFKLFVENVAGKQVAGWGGRPVVAKPEEARKKLIDDVGRLLVHYENVGVAVKSGQGYVLSKNAAEALSEIEIEKGTMESARLKRALASPQENAEYIAKRGDAMLALVETHMPKKEDAPPAVVVERTGLGIRPGTQGSALGFSGGRGNAQVPGADDGGTVLADKEAIGISQTAVKAVEVKNEAQFKSWVETQFKNEGETRNWIIANSTKMYEEFRRIMNQPDMKNESDIDGVVRGYVGIAAAAQMA